jgi:integrase/recombinase XerD
MLMKAVESYLAVRRAAGYKLEDSGPMLRHFARFAMDKGECFIHCETAIEWAGKGPSPRQRARRLRIVNHLARYLRAEDPRHEIPSRSVFVYKRQRPTPFIYEQADVVRLVYEAAHLEPSRMEPADSSLPLTFSTLLSLLASTGLRPGEALALRLDDITSEGLLIRETKFRKSRLVPLHDTAVAGLQRYLDQRRRFPTSDDHVFVSPWGRALKHRYVEKKFRQVVQQAGLEPSPGQPRPQLQSFRHTFAVRALQACPDGRDRIGQHMLALSTYLGHARVTDTYWYLQAVPELMTDIAHASENFVKGELS